MAYIKDKRGVSVLIGYVLLVVFAIIIAVIVYSWLRSYVPAEALNCPEGVSLFVQEASFDNTNSQLQLVLSNNGRFDVSGYFIHATNDSSQEQPSIDLSSYFNDTTGGAVLGNAVVFSTTGENAFAPNEQETDIFDIPSSVGAPYSIRVIPTRFQEEDNRERFVSCGDARIIQIVGAPITPPTCGNGLIELGEQCDDGDTSNGDGCSGSCSVETGWQCTGEPSSCTPLGPVFLFFDDFESYSVDSGLPLYSEMEANSWTVIDRTAPIFDDDIWLDNNLEYNGTYSVAIQDDSEIVANISTIGYSNIILGYARRTSSLPSNDELEIRWCVGNCITSGNWNTLEIVSGTVSSYSVSTFNLPSSANNQPLIQISFFLDDGNGDIGLIDEIRVTGT